MMKKGKLYKTDLVKDRVVYVNVDKFAHGLWLKACASAYHKDDSQREVLTEILHFYLNNHPAFKPEGEQA